MTARRKPPSDSRRSMKPAEWDRMVRQRAYIPAPPPPLPLHVMAKARILAVGTDNPTDDGHQADSKTTNQKGTTA